MTIAPGTSPSDHGRQNMVLWISCLSLFIAGLDVTIVNVALPTIAMDFKSSLAQSQWIVGAYTVVLASLLMLSGSTSDRVGRRLMFILGLEVFSGGSLLAALAPSVDFLIGSRVIQAVGGAIISPVAVSIIATTFKDPRERARALGLRGSVFGVSLALGPVAGGVLVSWLGWRSIFVLNCIVGIITLVLSLRFISDLEPSTPRRFDPVGQGLVVTLFSTLTYGIIEGPGQSWTSVTIVSFFVVAGASLVCLVFYENRRVQPLIDLRFFGSIPFSAASAIAIFAFGAFGGFLFLNTLYLQDVRGLLPVEAGLATLPIAGAVIAGSLISGRLLASRGPRVALVGSGVFCALGCLLLIDMSATTPLPQLLTGYTVFGLGFGLVNAPVTNAAISGMPQSQAGVASAVASTSRQFGQTLGVAIVGSIAASSVNTSLGDNFTNATRPAWWVLTFCSLLVFGLAFLATGKLADRSVRHVAHQLNTESQQ